jgi:plasmid stability protein
MVRINIEIPDDVHARLKMMAAAEGKGFYEWLKEDLIQACPDEETLLEILRAIREDRAKQESE